MRSAGTSIHSSSQGQGPPIDSGVVRTSPSASGCEVMIMVRKNSCASTVETFYLDNVGISYQSTSTQLVLVKAGYRYGFNGQEKDNEVMGEGNSYTAEFWNYDVRLGRRWNVDPKPIVGFSSYSVMLGNPIHYNDPLGDIVGGDEEGMENYNDYREEVNARIDFIKGKMKGLDVSSEEFLDLNKQLEDYQTINCELDRLEKDQNNLYYINSNVMFESDTKGGQFSFGGYVQYEGREVKKLNIDITKTPFPMDQIAHEFKHAYQFFQGRLIFIEGNDPLNSIELENEAFERGDRFSGLLMVKNFSSKWLNYKYSRKSLPSRYDVLEPKTWFVTPATEKDMQEYFRKNGQVPIYNLPNE